MQSNQLDYYYLRLSLEDGDTENGSIKESCSISSQRMCIRQFINKNIGNADDFVELVDDGFTGTNMNRPSMQKLIREVESGRVRTIIVRDLSRFSRDYLEAGHFLEFIFPAYDVRFISINENFDSYKLGETTGGWDITIQNLINTMYSKDISKKIKSAVDLKKLNGEFVYGNAPYGYKKGERKNTIVVDDEVECVVKDIFTYASNGMTITNIARLMNEKHIPTPSMHLSKYRSKNYRIRTFWNFESVRNILANRIYTGDTEPFKSHVVRVGSNNVKMIPEEERLVIPNTHEAIISRELFYQAKAAIHSRKKSKGKRINNPFTSLLVCSCCGNKLQKGKEKNKNWLCSSARYYSEIGCADIRIDNSTLYDVVLRAIVTQCRLVDTHLKELSKNTEAFKTKQELLQSEYRKIKRQLEKIMSSKMNLYEEYATGNLSKEDYLKKKADGASAETELKTKASVIKQRLAQNEKDILENSEVSEAAKQMTGYNEISELTPELTKELIKKITVYPDNVINIEWNYIDEIDRIIQFHQNKVVNQ